MIIGTAFGAGKGRAGSGLVWTWLLGPIGILVVAFLPNLKRAEHERQARLHEEQLQMQSAQLEQMPSATGFGFPTGETLHVSRNGDNVGQMPITKIQALLRAGKLGKSDYYFDPQVKEWVALEFLDGLDWTTPDQTVHDD